MPSFSVSKPPSTSTPCLVPSSSVGGLSSPLEEVLPTSTLEYPQARRCRAAALPDLSVAHAISAPAYYLAPLRPVPISEPKSARELIHKFSQLELLPLQRHTDTPAQFTLDAFAQRLGNIGLAMHDEDRLGARRKPDSQRSSSSLSACANIIGNSATRRPRHSPAAIGHRFWSRARLRAACAHGYRPGSRRTAAERVAGVVVAIAVGRLDHHVIRLRHVLGIEHDGFVVATQIAGKTIRWPPISICAVAAPRM